MLKFWWSLKIEKCCQDNSLGVGPVSFIFLCIGWWVGFLHWLTDWLIFLPPTGEPDKELNPKKKIWEQIQPDLYTDDNCVATYKGIPFQVKGKGVCRALTMAKSGIKWDQTLPVLEHVGGNTNNNKRNKFVTYR